MAEAHAAVHRGHEPVPIWRPVQSVKVMQVAVDVFARFSRLQIVDEQPLAREVRVGEFVELAFHVGDLRTVGTPAGLAAVGGDFDAPVAIAIHVVDIADLGVALALIRDEADFRAVRRRLGIQLIDIWGARQVDGIGAVGVT